MHKTGDNEEERSVSLLQLLEAFGHFSATLAHEWNNQLTVVSGYSHLLLAQLPVGDARREFVRAISEANQRSAEWTSRLLAASSRNRPELGPVELGSFLVEWAEQFPARAFLRHARDPSAQAAIVISSDSASLRRMLDELVQWAEPFSEGAKFDLRVSQGELPDQAATADSRALESRAQVLLELHFPTVQLSGAEQSCLSDPMDWSIERFRKSKLSYLLLQGAAFQLGADLTCVSGATEGTQFFLRWQG